jgi:hypothetical protein
LESKTFLSRKVLVAEGRSPKGFGFQGTLKKKENDSRKRFFYPCMGKNIAVPKVLSREVGPLTLLLYNGCFTQIKM